MAFLFSRFLWSVAFSLDTVANTQTTLLPSKGPVKIVNDTKQDIHIYIGTGHVMLYHGGGSTSVSCDNDKEICLSHKVKKSAVIFKIDASMCGKTIKLSIISKIISAGCSLLLVESVLPETARCFFVVNDLREM